VRKVGGIFFADEKSAPWEVRSQTTNSYY